VQSWKRIVLREEPRSLKSGSGHTPAGRPSIPRRSSYSARSRSFSSRRFAKSALGGASRSAAEPAPSRYSSHLESRSSPSSGARRFTTLPSFTRGWTLAPAPPALCRRSDRAIMVGRGASAHSEPSIAAPDEQRSARPPPHRPGTRGKRPDHLGGASRRILAPLSSGRAGAPAGTRLRRPVRRLGSSLPWRAWGRVARRPRAASFARRAAAPCRCQADDPACRRGPGSADAARPLSPAGLPSKARPPWGPSGAPAVTFSPGTTLCHVGLYVRSTTPGRPGFPWLDRPI